MGDAAISVFGDVVATVGEAPLWSEREQALYWIDNTQRRVLRQRLAGGPTEVRELPYKPGCLAFLPDGGLLIGYRKGIGLFDFDRGLAHPLPLDPVVDLREVSFNDGACDPAGRFWIGTRHRDAKDPVAALYRVDGEFRITRMREGIVLSNGIAFSPDGRRLYHADSRPGRIFAYALDPATGELSEPQVLVDFDGLGRRPDGCTVDAEGYLWVAEIDGWRIARYAPDGRRDREIMLPIRKPSSLVFGGADFATLFVTSIRYGLTEDELRAQPLAGHVLTLRPGVRGLPEPVFRALPAAERLRGW